MGIFGSRNRPTRSCTAGSRTAPAGRPSGAVGPPVGPRSAMRPPGRVSSGTAMIEMARVAVVRHAAGAAGHFPSRWNEGETLVIIGESGCGKSVTLKLMMALLDPSRGRVLWRGRPVRDLARIGAGQGTAAIRLPVPGGRTVRQHAASTTTWPSACGRIPISPKQRIRAIVQDRLKEVGLQPGGLRPQAGRSFRRHEKTRRPGPRPGDGARGDVLRRADDRTRPGDERRDQRADPPHPGPRPRDEHRRHARHADRRAGRRPRRSCSVPPSQLAADESQILFEGTAQELDGLQPTRASTSSCTAKPENESRNCRSH